MTNKILHISNYYPPHIGGIEDVCYSIVSAVPQYEHKVICFHQKGQTEKDIIDGVEVIRCGVWKKLFSQSVSLFFYFELKKILREFSPDIIHFHTPNPLSSFYLKLLLPYRIKLIVHWHSDIVEQRLLHFFYRPVEEWLLCRADRILVTSPEYAPASKVLSPWRNKLQVLPNTVNSNKLQKQEGDEKEIAKIKAFHDEKKIVFAFGRHVTYKGFRYLIEAAPLISEDAVVVIAGQGPLTAGLKEISGAGYVYFPGRLDNDEVRQYLHASEVFAFPSITRNEAFGIALAEAMYCGLPAVTFNIPGSGVNWVCPDGKTGLEVENGNRILLADAINRLLKDDKLRRELGNNARKRVAEFFTIDAILKELIELYNK